MPVLDFLPGLFMLFLSRRGFAIYIRDFFAAKALLHLYILVQQATRVCASICVRQLKERHIDCADESERAFVEKLYFRACDLLIFTKGGSGK